MKKVQVILVTLFLISAASIFGSYFQNNFQVRDPWIQSIIDASKDVQAVHGVKVVKVVVTVLDSQGLVSRRGLQFEQKLRVTPSVHNDVAPTNKQEKDNV